MRRVMNDIVLPEKWQKRIDIIEHAFQPIVNPLSGGALFAVECLLRNYDQAGFNDIFEVFDSAYDDGLLLSVDLELRKKAIKKNSFSSMVLKRSNSFTTLMSA